MEWEVEWNASRMLDVKSNYAFQQARDSETDTPVAGVPRHQFFLEANWGFAPLWYLDGRFKWLSSRARQDGDPRKSLGGYQTMDLFLRRTGIFGRGELGVVVRNLFDSELREPSPMAGVPSGAYIPRDYPLEGRSISLVIKGSF